MHGTWRLDAIGPSSAWRPAPWPRAVDSSRHRAGRSVYLRQTTKSPFGTVDEAVDEGDDAGGGGEHAGPLREGFVGRDEHRQVEVPAGDDLEEEVGVAVVVVEVSDLVDGEELRAGEATQSPGERCVGVLSGEFVEHVRGGGEAGGEAVEDAVVEEVFHQHGLADAVRSDEDDVGGVVDEGEREQLLDERAVDTLGPGPVEVGDGFEGADAGVGQTPFEGTALALAVFDVDDAFDPGLGEDGVVLHGESVEPDIAQALSHGIGFTRRCVVRWRRHGVCPRRRSRNRRRGGRSRRGRGGAPRECAAAGRRAGRARAAGVCRIPCGAGR